MNNPNPFVSKGILIDQKDRSRARLRLAVFSVLGVPVLGLLVLLITQGCRREQPQNPAEEPTQTVETNLPTMETNPMVAVPTNPLPTVTPTPTPLPTPAAGATEYTVAKGDTFATIAKKLGVTTKAIQDANPNVDPRKLQISQKLVIPAPSTGTAATGGTGAAVATPPTAAGGEQVYVVKSGDTLTSIARSHGTTVRAIETANNLTSTRIKVGDKLKIPVKAAAPAPAETTPTSSVPVPAPSSVPPAK